MSIANGAGSRRSNRTRAPLAVVANTSAPLPPLTSTVSAPPPPSLRSVSSPGFHTIRSSPLSPNAWSSASPPVRVSFWLPPNRRSNPPRPTRVSLPACPKSWSPPAPPVTLSLPTPPNRFARGSAPLTSLRVITSSLPRPKTWISVVLATVGEAPTTATAPPLTRIVPTASRLTSMLLAALSPKTVSTPLVNVAVVAALADWLAAMTTPAPITVPTTSRRAARPRPLSLHPLISVLLSRAGPRWVGRGRPGLFSRAGNGCTVCNRGARGSTAVLNTVGKRERFAGPAPRSSTSRLTRRVGAARCRARLSAEVDALSLLGGPLITRRS